MRVYPRVGGETSDQQGAEHRDQGLSPRGRGNRRSPPAAGAHLRSIPAWAGKPND